MADLDAGIAEPVRERTIGPGDQHLLHVEAAKSPYQQLGLAFAATVSFCQVDVGDSHGH